MDTLFSYFIHLLYVYLNIRIIRIFLTKKERNPLSVLPFYGILASASWLSHSMIQNRKIFMILFFFLLFLFTMHQFETTAVKCLSVISISIGLTGITQGVVWYLHRYSDLLPRNEIYCPFLPCVLTLALILIWEHIFDYERSETPRTVYNFQIIFIALSSIALCGILISVTMISPVTLCICVSVIYLINILTLLMYSRLSMMQQREVENKTLEQRVIMYQNQFQIMQQSQEDLRSLRHDLKNHLLLVQTYLESNKIESAIQYIKDITQTHNTMNTYIHSGNEETDCVLNYLLELAHQMNCEIHTSIKIPSETFMSALDLNILISNLLTNAIEATTQCDHKYLNIAMKFDRNILYISIYNTFQGTLCRQNNYFQTTKKDQKIHGYGFKNIHSIIEKYHGESSFRTENGVFKADIILYLDHSV